MRTLFICCTLFFITINVTGQQANDSKQSITSQAIFDTEGELTISWLPKNDVSSYRIQYRTDLFGNWETAATGVLDSFYVFSEQWDSPVEISINTEDGDFATSYLLAGNGFFNSDQEEHMLLIITDSIFDALESIIEDYRNVMQNELVATEIIVVNESDSVPEIKDQIIAMHNEHPLDYILILGHVAVPYSGNTAIDGHSPDHQGAWVADGFYGELDGNWTDISVNSTDADRDANKNIPGDGKFDQITFPSEVEIAVGRVDFSDLPKLEQSEIELTRRYLLRNIDYRTGKIKATRRAIIDNNFNLPEGFGQGAIKSFHSFLEPDSINYGNFTQCTSQDYLFTFGAGGGSYQSAGGIINTNALVNDSIQSIFTTIFGSYFGDWDISNNLLRASLARGSSLINAWSGRPVWYFHQMAMGGTVGKVLLNTQNNNGNYLSQIGNRLCHISLLGDPSLKMYYHQPVDNIVMDDEEISWEYLANDSEVVGYTVYYQENDKWKLLGDGPRSETNVALAEIPLEGWNHLLIKPVGLIKSRSGSYFNEGNGVPVEVLITSTHELVESYKIFPNPAHDFIRISGPQQIKEVLIFDMYGQIVKSSFGDTEIHIASLVPGVYTLLINGEAARFVKQ